MTYKLDKLVHSEELFDDEYLRSRQKEYGFTQLSKVKTFLWDFELLGQLQRQLGSKVVLKGGAAAQLFSPPEKQRTSVDIDVIYSGTETDLLSTLESIHADFGRDETFFKFTKYTPKKPSKALPLLTFYVAVPDFPIEAKRQINIKLDFHMIHDLRVKTINLDDAIALGVPLAFSPHCLTVDSLVGDKILTLARGSVGIPTEREADIPKQLYDLNSLTALKSFDSLTDFQSAFDEFLKLELANTGDDVEEQTIFKQVIVTLKRYSTVGGNDADIEALKVLKEFRGNYEPRPFKSMLQWETLCKRLEYFTNCLAEKHSDSVRSLKKADEIANRVSTERDRQAMAKQLFNVLESMISSKGTKKFRNVMPERMFWEILSLNKITPDEIEGALFNE